jgi:glc operon protein GlcG
MRRHLRRNRRPVACRRARHSIFPTACRSACKPPTRRSKPPRPKLREAIAVTDPNGDLVAFAKMDDTQNAAPNIALRKAATAARFRRDTRTFYNAFEGGHTYSATLDPSLVASPGGYPLVIDGKIVGAIGCSGGSGDQDGDICKAGADATK